MSVDHLAAMRAAVIEQYKGLPNLDAFIHAVGLQLNDVEEFFGQLLTLRTLQLAVGTQIDRLGVLLSQGREGLSDSDYRTVLQARIVQYQANGTVEDIIQILLTLAGATQVQLIEEYPAGIAVTALGLAGAPLTASDAKGAVLQAKLAGVRAYVNTANLPAFTYDQTDASHSGYDAGHYAGPI